MDSGVKLIEEYGSCKPYSCYYMEAFLVKSSTFLLNFRAFMTGEQSYKYYNEFMWKGRYAECISVEETIDRMKG